MRRDIYIIVRGALLGYSRRKTEYEERLDRMTDTLRASNISTKTRANNELNPIEQNAEAYLELDRLWSTKAIRAVDFAKDMVVGIHGKRNGEKIYKALMLNAQDPFKYTYKVLDKTIELNISRATFFRRKEDFYSTIADILELK